MESSLTTVPSQKGQEYRSTRLGYMVIAFKGKKKRQSFPFAAHTVDGRVVKEGYHHIVPWKWWGVFSRKHRLRMDVDTHRRRRAGWIWFGGWWTGSV